MKKVIMSVAILLASLTTSLFALEWGGLVNNTTVVTTPDFKGVKINQGNEFYLWANGPLNKSQTLRFAAEGKYKFNWDSYYSNYPNHGMDHALDVTLLKLSGNWVFGNKKLLLDVGRFNYADKVGAYFFQPSDGLSLRYEAISSRFGLYAGYTGLLNKHTVLMQNDVDLGEENSILYDFTYGYVPIMLDATFSHVGPLEIGLQASYFLDIANKGKASQAYGTVTLAGGLSNIGQYSVNLVAGTNNFKDLMMYGAADITFYVNDNVLLMVGSEYASGKNESMKISTFRPITARPFGTGNEIDSMVIAPRASSVFMIGNFLMTLNEKLTLSLYNEKFEVNSLDSNLSMVYNVFSDLQLGLSGMASVNFKDKSQNNYGVVVNASLSF